MSIGPQAKMGLDDVCPQCCGPLVVGQFLEDDPERWDRFECPLARKRRWVSMTCARKRRGPLVEIEERSYIYILWVGLVSIVGETNPELMTSTSWVLRRGGGGFGVW